MWSAIGWFSMEGGRERERIKRDRDSKTGNPQGNFVPFVQQVAAMPSTA